MNKLIRDGKVAVLYSPGYGAGWYTWHHNSELIFNSELILMVEKGLHKTEEFLKQCEKIEPTGYLGGVKDLKIQWIPVGTRFEINEYDGNESIRYLTPDDGLIA